MKELRPAADGVHTFSFKWDSLSKLIILTNPKLKSKVQVQVQTDDWVLIKIGFSNHPPPASYPLESFKEVRYSNIRSKWTYYGNSFVSNACK